MFRYLFFILTTTILFFSEASGQNVVSGFVVNEKNGLPLCYANIYLKSKSNIGTISNSEGRFSLLIPREHIRDSIVISFIGFQKIVVAISENKGDNAIGVIRLIEDQKVLDAVTVFAEDTLLNLLKSAYLQIGANYPQTSSLIKGFYRETNALEPEKKFIYFSESVIEFYSPPYTKSNYGPVRIIEGGKLELEDRLNYTNVYFYAGIYSAQRFDFVKERIEFINPKNFHKYHYSQEDNILNDGRKTYVVSFKADKNALYEGKIFIDSETLAYVKGVYRYTDEGIRNQNFAKLSSFNYESRLFEVQYKFVNKLWHINLVTQDGLGSNNKYKNKVRYTNEFVTLNIKNVDKNPISDAEAVPFQAFYTEQKNKFSDTFWSKPEIIARTAAMEKTVNLIFRSDQINKDNLRKDSAKLNSHKPVRPKGQKLAKISSKLSSGLSFAWFPIEYESAIYNLSYQNLFDATKDVQNKSLYVWGFDFKYYPIQSLAVAARFYGNLTNHVKLSLGTLGLEYSKRLVGWRRPLYIQPGLSLYLTNYEMNLGNTSLNADFTIGNTTINANEVNVGVGQTRFGVLGSVEFVYKFHSRFGLSFRASTSIYSQENDKMFVHEVDRSIFGGKSAQLDLSSNDITFSKNNKRQTQSPIELMNFKPIFEIGLRYGLFK